MYRLRTGIACRRSKQIANRALCVLQRWPSKTASAAMLSGYNWFLIIITVIVSILAVGVALYLLIVYQHPEDRNQVR